MNEEFIKQVFETLENKYNVGIEYMLFDSPDGSNRMMSVTVKIYALKIYFTDTININRIDENGLYARISKAIENKYEEGDC